jgi:hypothetical protein
VSKEGFVEKNDKSKKKVPLEERTPGKLLILMLYAFIPVQTSFIFQSVLHKENI